MKRTWYFPFLFALPFLAGLALVVTKYGQRLNDLLTIALKMAVRP